MARRLSLALIICGAASAIAQTTAPPPPPGPPQFMSMRGYPLSCFRKAAFEEDGLEFFVCQGGTGLTGVRKKSDPAQTIWVREPDIAHNLNMQVAKGKCPDKRFAVSSPHPEMGVFSFLCDGKEIRQVDPFKAASAADWKKYLKYLH